MPDLCTAQQVYDLVGKETPVNAPTWALLISAASAAFVNFTNRTNILAQSFSETYDGDDSCTLILRNTPVLSITSLSIAGRPQAPSTGYASPGYVLGDDGFTLELVRGSFCLGRRNVSVTYQAGFATVPLDIQQAVAEMVVWKKAKMPRLDLVSQTLQGAETISYSQAALPPSVKDVIAYYTKPAGGFRRR